MQHVTCLQCVKCGRRYAPDETLYTCLDCGIEGTLDVIYDMERVAQRFLQRIWSSNTRRLAQETRETGRCPSSHQGIWRYLELLPVQDERFVPPLQVGWTPMYHCDRLVQHVVTHESLTLPNRLYVKDDGRNPTASFKDRASALAVVKAKELQKDVITCASTGNAASSLAGLAAATGITSYIFVPDTAPKAKVAQLLMYGANVIMIKGTYDQAFDLCLQASEEWGWYSRNTGYNPYLGEGKKTAALEICEQLGWQAPDKVFVSVGDGCIIGGMWKGFCDLHALGLIEKRPQMIGIQSEGANPLVTAFERNQSVTPLAQTTTLADSIAVGHPRDGLKALRAVRDSNGRMLSVRDEDILHAMQTLARYTGVFAEPAGAAAFAGMTRLAEQGQLDADERVVVMVTGNGLKDIDTAIRTVGEPTAIAPDFDEVKRFIDPS